MSFVDFAKTAKKAAEKRFTPNPVVFHHVPKCGGTSVGRALRKKYLLSQATVMPEESFRAFAAYTGRSDRIEMLTDVTEFREQMLLYLLYCEVACISAHVPFNEVAFEEFSETYRFITILREPVSRFVSHYWWSFGRAGLHGRIEEEFDVFLGTDYAKRLGANYCEYYAGMKHRSDLRSDGAIKAALENLQKFDAVGRLDDLPQFTSLLRDLLGTSISIQHENKNARAPAAKRPQLTDSQVARLRELCAPDMAIWNEVVANQRDAQPAEIPASDHLTKAES